MNSPLDFFTLLCQHCNQRLRSSTSEAQGLSSPMAQRKSPKPRVRHYRPTKPAISRKPSKSQQETIDAVKALFPKLQISRIEHHKKAAFLLHFCTTGQIRKSANAIGCSVYTPYLWMQKDPAFAEGVELAKSFAAMELESELMRRAMDGIPRGVWHQGIKVGEEQHYSDTLGIFLLKGAMPEKYHENRLTTHEVSASWLALQQQWLEQRDAPVPQRQLTGASDIIDIDVEPTRSDAITQTPRTGEHRPAEGSTSKEQTFAMLDALNNTEEDDDEDD
jgi:hypothetical protein